MPANSCWHSPGYKHITRVIGDYMHNEPWPPISRWLRHNKTNPITNIFSARKTLPRILALKSAWPQWSHSCKVLGAVVANHLVSMMGWHNWDYTPGLLAVHWQTITSLAVILFPSGYEACCACTKQHSCRLLTHTRALHLDTVMLCSPTKSIM